MSTLPASSTAAEPETHPTHEPTHDATHTVALRRTVAAPVRHVWEVLVSAAGTAALLGESVDLGDKGSTYRMAGGAGGVVRSVHPDEQLRLTWHETPDAPASLIEIDLAPEGDATRLDLRHERLLPDAVSRWAAVWEDRLEALIAASLR